MQTVAAKAMEQVHEIVDDKDFRYAAYSVDTFSAGPLPHVNTVHMDDPDAVFEKYNSNYKENTSVCVIGNSVSEDLIKYSMGGSKKSEIVPDASILMIDVPKDQSRTIVSHLRKYQSEMSDAFGDKLGVEEKPGQGIYVGKCTFPSKDAAYGAVPILFNGYGQIANMYPQARDMIGDVITGRSDEYAFIKESAALSDQAVFRIEEDVYCANQSQVKNAIEHYSENGTWSKRIAKAITLKEPEVDTPTLDETLMSEPAAADEMQME